jgi:hypothetical protein
MRLLFFHYIKTSGAFKTTMISSWISIEISCLFDRGENFTRTGSRSLGITQIAYYAGIIG